MRLKNIKGAKERIELSNYIIKDPYKEKGKYSKLFGNNNLNFKCLITSIYWFTY